MAHHILIADDTAAIREVLRDALIDEGYDVAKPRPATKSLLSSMAATPPGRTWR